MDGLSGDIIQVALLAAGMTAVYVAGLLGLEYWAGKKGKPLITVAMRAAVKRVPWVFIVLATVFGMMAGHCFLQ